MSKAKGVWTWLSVVLVLALVGAAAYFVLEPQIRPHVNVRLGDGVFLARVAKTEEERIKGLSGTPGLRDTEAMLLVYDRDDKWSIWMKDMRYSLDIIRLNKDKEVVHIVKNAPPESYPYESFVSKEAARYVLELKAGMVDKKRIKIGSQAAFDENNVEGWRL